MTKHRIETPATLYAAISLISQLQNEGWGLDHMEQRVKYGKVTKHGQRVPIGTTLTIGFIPPR